MARKPVPTRTTGPLHLEDLEPHRFEDLVRQLLYDFRPWRQLEATGRAGGDEGFDARASEASGDISMERDDEEIEVALPDRVWLIQCKRERAFGPAKLRKYLSELPTSSTEGVYGIVFVAACDFSLATRNAFREATRDIGF